MICHQHGRSSSQGSCPLCSQQLNQQQGNWPWPQGVANQQQQMQYVPTMTDICIKLDRILDLLLKEKK